MLNGFNRDLEIPKGDDYVLRFEFTNNENQSYEFDEENDSLKIYFSDVKGSIEPEDPIDIPLNDIENPVSVIIPKDYLNIFEKNPIKYKLILNKGVDNLTLTLLSGYIYRT